MEHFRSSSAKLRFTTYHNDLWKIKLRILSHSTKDILQLGGDWNQLIHGGDVDEQNQSTRLFAFVCYGCERETSFVRAFSHFVQQQQERKITRAFWNSSASGDDCYCVTTHLLTVVVVVVIQFWSLLESTSILPLFRFFAVGLSRRIK